LINGIDESTECIHLDENRVDMMDVDDWNIITQGGWTMLERKGKVTYGFINRVPTFITPHVDLDFRSKEDKDVM